MSRSKLLFDVQVLDSRRDAAMQRLRVVVMSLRADGAVPAARAALESELAALADVEAKMRRIAVVRTELKERVVADEKRLYGGAVLHPKEIEGQQRTLDGHRRQLGEEDDRALELLMARDEARDAVQRAKDELAAAEELEAADRDALTAEQGQLARQIRGMAPIIAAARARVSAQDLARYDRLRDSAGMKGKAVASLEGDACGGCGRGLPRLEAAQARGQDELATCPGCGRLVHG